MPVVDLVKVFVNSVAMMEDRGLLTPPKEKEYAVEMAGLMAANQPYPNLPITTKFATSWYQPPVQSVPPQVIPILWIPLDRGINPETPRRSVSKDQIKTAFDEVLPYILGYQHYRVNHLIVVSDPFHSAADEELTKWLGQYGLRVEQFRYEWLATNPVKHMFTPRHAILTPGQIKEVVGQLKTPVSQWPKIKPDDALARWYGLTAGQAMVFYPPSVLVDGQEIPKYKAVG